MRRACQFNLTLTELWPCRRDLPCLVDDITMAGRSSSSEAQSGTTADTAYPTTPTHYAGMPRKGTIAWYPHSSGYDIPAGVWW